VLAGIPIRWRWFEPSRTRYGSATVSTRRPNNRDSRGPSAVIICSAWRACRRFSSCGSRWRNPGSSLCGGPRPATLVICKVTYIAGSDEGIQTDAQPPRADGDLCRASDQGARRAPHRDRRRSRAQRRPAGVGPITTSPAAALNCLCEAIDYAGEYIAARIDKAREQYRRSRRPTSATTAGNLSARIPRGLSGRRRGGGSPATPTSRIRQRRSSIARRRSSRAGRT